MRRRRHTQALVSLGLGLSAAAIIGLRPAVSADAPNLAYSKDVSWHMDDAPQLSAMESTIRSVLTAVHVTYSGVSGDQVEGFFPGPTYSYAPINGANPF